MTNKYKLETEIKIRPAEIDELERLKEIEQLIIQAEHDFERNFRDGEIFYYDLEALINSNDAIVLVAESEGEIIATGYAKIKPSLDYLLDDIHAYLGFMFVEPEFRGKGVIQDIIRELISWSKLKGMTVVCLEVLNKNDSAIKAYKQLGFEKNLVEMRLDL